MKYNVIYEASTVLREEMEEMGKEKERKYSIWFKERKCMKSNQRMMYGKLRIDMTEIPIMHKISPSPLG